MRKWTWLAGAFAALIAGCVSYNQQTTVNADGSGRMVMDMWVDDFGDLAGTAETPPPATAGTAEAPPGTAVAPGPGPAEPTVSEEMGPAFVGLEGVTIEENWVKKETEGEGDAAKKREHTRLVLAFDNISRLNGYGVFAKQELKAEKTGGNFYFSQLIHNEPKKEDADASAESEELARQMFEGYTFTYSLVMPGKVKETNGTVGDDKRTVSWSWPLYDFSQMKEVRMEATSASK